MDTPHRTATSRRRFLTMSGATLALAGCDTARRASERVGLDRIELPSLPDNGPARIDARVDVAREFLLTTYPGVADLEARSAGQLYMPLITEVGLGLGGSYGTGALRIGGATVDYFAAFSASTGFQAGAQQFSHALFFMTPEALRTFRTQRGWSVGGDVSYALPDRGGNLSADTFTLLDPVVALVFAQNGLKAGASLEGTFYQRIRP